MYQVNNTADIAEVFKKHLKAGNFVQDRTGVKTIEILGASFVADKPAIFGEPNKDYIEKELMWYDKKSTNVYDIYGHDIRDNMLHASVQMRSNDVIFGYRNDYAWQRHVQEKLQDDLYYNGIKTELGYIYWQVQNLHVYERHFDLVV